MWGFLCISLPCPKGPSMGRKGDIKLFFRGERRVDMKQPEEEDHGKNQKAGLAGVPNRRGLMRCGKEKLRAGMGSSCVKLVVEAILPPALVQRSRRLLCKFPNSVLESCRYSTRNAWNLLSLLCWISLLPWYSLSKVLNKNITHAWIN